MRKSPALSLALLVLLTGSVKANGFLNGLVGTWDAVSVVQLSSVRETTRTTTTIRKLRNGSYYGSTREKKTKEKTGETWYYRNGSILTVEYDNGGVYAEGTGTWRIKGGRLAQDITLDGLDGRIRMKGTMRKLGRDRYTEVGTFTLGSYRGRYTVNVTRATR